MSALKVVIRIEPLGDDARAVPTLSGGRWEVIRKKLGARLHWWRRRRRAEDHGPLTRHVRAIRHDQHEIDDRHEDDEVDDPRNERAKSVELTVQRPTQTRAV